MKHFYIILVIALTLFACKKDRASAGKDVEIYLLKSFQLVAGKCQVDASTVVLQDQPLVTNSDILVYSQADYEYTLSDVSYQRIKSLTPRTAFAFRVDKKVIFYCIYMPSFMSSTCGSSITMDLKPPEKEIYLRLGYPWSMDSSIDDQRNNEVLLATFRNQRKLR